MPVRPFMPGDGGLSCDHGFLLSRSCAKTGPLWLAQNCLSWKRVLLSPWPQAECVGLKQAQDRSGTPCTGGSPRAWLFVDGAGLLKRPGLHLAESEKLIWY